MKKLIILFLAFGLLIGGTVTAQASDRSGFGLETDLMVYRIGESDSYSFGANYYKDQFKYSLFNYHINVVDAHLTEGFSKNIVDAYVCKVERYFNVNASGFFLGGGILYESSDLTTSANSQKGHLNMYSLLISLGYDWNPTKKFHIIPNLHILLPLEDTDLKIGTDEVKLASWGLEPGVKIGIEF